MHRNNLHRISSAGGALFAWTRRTLVQYLEVDVS